MSTVKQIEPKRGPGGRYAKGSAGGPGRPKGSANVVTKAMRELFREAFDELGGKDYIIRLANSKGKGSLAARMAVLNAFTKLLPVEVTGDGGGPLVIRVENLDKSE